MNYYLQINHKVNKLEDGYVYDTKGEFQIYDNNIRQKAANKVNLKYVFNENEIYFSNFGYSREGNIFAYLYANKYLILYDFVNLRTIEMFELPEEVKNNIFDFVYEEKRSFIKKLFTRLSFLELNSYTNNIYMNEKGTFIVLSSCTKYFFNLL
jgi:hypothetical protein